MLATKYASEKVYTSRASTIFRYYTIVLTVLRLLVEACSKPKFSRKLSIRRHIYVILFFRTFFSRQN